MCFSLDLGGELGWESHLRGHRPSKALWVSVLVHLGSGVDHGAPVSNHCL